MVLLLTIISPYDLSAREGPDSAKFSVAIAPGLSVGPSPDALASSSFSVGVGLEYGPVVTLEGALLKASLESGYSQQLGKTDLFLNASDRFLRPNSSIIRRVPVMIWCTVESGSNISPFIRLGAGISWTQFVENYSEISAAPLETSDWGFTWGIGGGIRVNVDRRWSLALFLDDWVSVENIEGIVNSNMGSFSRSMPGPIKMTMVGIRGTLNIF